jgi:hypothetical protein
MAIDHMKEEKMLTLDDLIEAALAVREEYGGDLTVATPDYEMGRPVELASIAEFKVVDVGYTRFIPAKNYNRQWGEPHDITGRYWLRNHVPPKSNREYKFGKMLYIYQQ